MADEKTTYLDAGVDIDEGARLVELIKPMVATTTRPEVLSGLGGFGALFRLDLSRYKKPLLVAGTDGVGTKLKVAFMADKHDTVGVDLVAMSVNDVLVQGAEPLFFLDYFAVGRLDADRAAEVVSGIAEGCRQSGCALIGGETAEMPGFYGDGEYELAGFAVGIVDEDKVVDGSSVKPGDIITGLSSNGLHSNGYSLVRKIFFEKLGLELDSEIPEFGHSLGQELLRPTRIYAKPCLAMLGAGKVKALAHITGGGFIENIPRVLPENTCARISKETIPAQPVFSYLQKAGHIDEREMFRTFNMGIGMAVICAPEDVDELKNAAAAKGGELIEIGRIEETDRDSFVSIE